MGVLICASLSFGSSALRAEDPEGGWSSTERDLVAAMARSDFAAARGVVSRLGVTNEARAVEMLVKHALTGKDYELERHVAGAIARMNSEKARAEVFEHVRKSFDARSVVVLLAVCAHWNDEASIAALHSALESRNKEICLAAIAQIRKLASPKSIVALIELLESLERRPHGRIYFDVQRALKDLTGADLEASIDWKNYWKGREEGITTPKKPRESGRTEVARTPSFFSVSVESDRLLFIVDISGSMTQRDTVIREPERVVVDSGQTGRTQVRPPGQPGTDAPTQELVMRITRVKNELIRTLRGLPPHVRFSILAYNHELAYYNGAGSLHLANKASVERAVEWVAALQPSGATRTDAALADAFSLPEIDTIYLLTDGAPKTRDNQKIPNEVVLGVAKVENRFRKCRIHTIGFAQAGHTMKLLCEQLAADNDGVCVLLD